MKKILSAAALLAAFGLGLPAHADVRVESILVNQSAPTPEGTNVRVNLFNEGVLTERPSTVELHVRENPNSEWRTVKVWNWDRNLASGERLSLDYLPAQGQPLHSALTLSQYELRAVVNGVSGPLSSYQHVHQAGVDEPR